MSLEIYNKITDFLNSEGFELVSANLENSKCSKTMKKDDVRITFEVSKDE